MNSEFAPVTISQMDWEMIKTDIDNLKIRVRLLELDNKELKEQLEQLQQKQEGKPDVS